MIKKIPTAAHPGIAATPLRVGPSTGSEFNLVRGFLIPKACFKFLDAHFAFDSSFISPDGFDITQLSELLDAHAGAKLSIFGHADPSGDDEYNKTLSGRRAAAVYDLLTRNVAGWDNLHDHAKGGDDWKPHAEETMQATTALPDGTDRATLFRTYMDTLCTVRGKDGKPVLDGSGKSKQVLLTDDDFLARGKGKDHKGDIQGCSEFNALTVFSKDERAFFDKPENHEERDEKNSVNRRVMVLLFRPGSQVDPGKWPCPTVDENTAKCQRRFYSDGERRRSNQAKHREFKDTADTFACRFYDRISNNSPCDVPVPSIPFTVATVQAFLASTQNAAPPHTRSGAGSFATANTSLTFAAPAADLMVAIENSGEILIKAHNIQPPTEAHNVRWQIERDPSDTVAAGTPALDDDTGSEIRLTPNTPGTFRLICYRDANGNDKHDAGEELRVLRMVIVRIRPQPGATLTTSSVFTGAVNGVSTGVGAATPMNLQADFLLEGGGANRLFGLTKVVLANVGNLIDDTFAVNYPGRAAPNDIRAGTESEDPDFQTNPAAGFPTPMVDTVGVAQGAEPTGGTSPNRGNSTETIQGNGPGGNGQIKRIASLDQPAFGWDGAHPTTNNPWATTQGVNHFREWILAHTTTFPRNYTALARGDWTVTVTGTSAAGGAWTDSGSTVTGNVLTTAGFPQTADAAGAQVLGRSFVREFGMIVNP